ncbi:MAG: hypothetical protein Q8R15_04100 [Candidatus Micrarchaeota archaeon]|nr:hypothetical protein [Candidatus Micrarchaeota archaeon]
MGKLFPGVPRIKNDPKRIAALNPSLWLGLLPVIGGLVTTPMQVNEIDRANDWQSAAHHFVKLLATESIRRQLTDTAGKPLGYTVGSNAVAVSRPETRVVVARHLQRRQLLDLMASRNRVASPRSLRPPLETRSVASRLQVRLPVRRFEGNLNLRLQAKPLQRSVMQPSSQARA